VPDSQFGETEKLGLPDYRFFFGVDGTSGFNPNASNVTVFLMV